MTRKLELVPGAARVPLSIGDVIKRWTSQGPLVHEPTGIARLDELTGGGPVYGERWYLAGAPDAGKTALLVQIAHTYAARGIAVGLLAVDEEPSDLVARVAQRIGHGRQACERRAHREVAAMLSAIGNLPMRIYDADWSIESAASDLASYAAGLDSPAMLGIDSIQSVTCDTESNRELSEVAAVTARVRAIRAAASRHRLIVLATSELGRAAYRSADPDQRAEVLAAGKWSGAIEYSARVLIGLRSILGESDLTELELAKNKHGPRGERVYLRLDRRTQSFTPVEYDPGPPPKADRDATARERVRADARVVATVLEARPGLSVRALRGAVRAQTGAGSERVDAALAALGGHLDRVGGCVLQRGQLG